MVIAATRAGRSYVPVQDIALIDMRVRDVWSLDIPLVGPYSRLGWSHPGPLMYYLLAPLSLVTGGAAWATLVGSALLQGVAVARTATGPFMLLEAWNPHVAFPFFVPYLLQAWLIGAAFVASLLVQSHIGYLPLVIVIAAWALWRRRGDLHREGRRLRDLGAWRPAAILTAVLWFPPLLENAVRWPGVDRVAPPARDPARGSVLGDETRPAPCRQPPDRACRARSVGGVGGAVPGRRRPQPLPLLLAAHLGDVRGPGLTVGAVRPQRGR